ncbi:MAG TPA: SH3-like domain-containing protein [Mycobacterium sp.]|nr:SH3-like domain-containing protein [Mycobacterium sp.]
MDGVHDLGGLDGFGPVERETSEPLFEQDWERRVFRLMIGSLAALGGPGGRFRHSIERMVPEHYLSSPYYEHWLTGVTTMAVESGFTTPEELERRAGGRFPLSRPDRGVLPDDLTPHTGPRYSVGDEIRVRAWHPPGHTRAPRYVQGKRGTIVRCDGSHNIADIEAHGGGFVTDPQYSVRFTSRELWGEAGADGEVMHVDLFERYLEEPR